MKGTVKWFNQRKGYGFIRGKNNKEIFVHRNSLPDKTTLNDHDKVEYDIEDTNKGPQATNVKRV